MAGNPAGTATLFEFVKSLRDEIRQAQDELAKSGRSGTLKLDSIEVETKIVAGKEKSGEGGIKAYILTLGGSKKVRQEEIHTVKMTISPIEAKFVVAGRKKKSKSRK